MKYRKANATKLCPAILVACMGLSAPAVSQAGPATHHLVMPAQALDQAVTQLAQQTGLNIGGDAKLLTAKTAPALNGDYTPEQALRTLLSDSGVVFEFSNSNTVKLLKLSSSDQQGAVKMLPISVVGGNDQSLAGPDFGYVGQTSNTALKMDVPISETPRSISIVTREQMDDRASVSVADALQYVPSIQANHFGEDNKQDWFIVRGFKQANNGLFRDGLRTYSSGFYSWQIDPFSLERVEILRGPSSVLYGQTPPGGVINVISKRPQGSESFGSVSAEYGSYDRKQLSLDIGAPVGDNDDMSYRLVALGRDNGTQVDDVEAERTLLAPSFNIRFNEQTNLTLLATYQEDDSDPYLQFLPSEGVLFAGPNGFIDDDVAVGNPDFETFKRTQATFGYQLEHVFNDSVSFEQSARYSMMDIDLKQMYFLFFAPGSTTDIVRYVSTEDGEADSFALDNRLLFNWQGDSVEHNILVGLDYQKLDIEGKDFASDPIAIDGNTLSPNFNIYNPTYTDNVVLLDPGTMLPLTDADRETRTTNAHQVSGYLQDHITINDKLVLNLGARYDYADYKFRNKTSGSKQDVDNQEWTGSAGLAYLFDNGVTPYVSYSSYFQPILRLDSSGDPAKPEQGQQLEAGIKYQPAGFDGYFNAAVFQITQENLAKTVLGQLTQIGEVESEGVELEAVANITPALSLVANATFMDTEITKNATASQVGMRPAQVADTLASAWVNYRFMTGSLDGLAVGTGVRYVGESFGDNTETVEVPSFTLWDATISYSWDDFKIQLAAKNLADKEYVATCDYFCWYGNRRNVIASFTYNW